MGTEVERITMKRKKLCYILPLYDPSTDTHYAYLYDFLIQVAKEVELFVIVEKASTAPKELKKKAKVYVQKFSFLPFRLVENMLCVFFVRMTGFKYFYSHYTYIGALSAISITKIFGGKTFYWNCGMPWLYATQGMKERVFRFILRNSYLVTGTEDVARDYARVYELKDENIRIIPNWINTKDGPGNVLSKSVARQILGVRQDTYAILFIHHLSKRKGTHKLIPIATKLREKTRCVFLIVGDGEERTVLEKEIKEKELGETIHIVGKIPHKDISVYYRAADAFLMPSDEEGFPHVLLEASLYELPYVVADVGGVRDISPQEESPYIIEKDNILGYRDALLRIRDDVKIREAIVENVKKYDTENALSQFIQLLTT